VRVVAPVKPFEDVRKVLWRDADPRIRNFKDHLRVGLPHFYPDCPAFECIPDRVVKELIQRFVEQIAIRVEHWKSGRYVDDGVEPLHREPGFM